MSDRRVVVWGASGGIGRALVDALAASGNYAVVDAGSRTPIEPVSDVVHPFAFDLLDEGSLGAAAEDRGGGSSRSGHRRDRVAAR